VISLLCSPPGSGRARAAFPLGIGSETRFIAYPMRLQSDPFSRAKAVATRPVRSSRSAGVRAARRWTSCLTQLSGAKAKRIMLDIAAKYDDIAERAEALTALTAYARKPLRRRSRQPVASRLLVP
jgi:hypothetical protein